MREKAYKLLAQQLDISNKKAKELIDRGLVYVGNRKVMIARGELPVGTKFNVKKLQKPEIIYEDENIVAINKPPFVVSDELASEYELIHRLDKETSGVLLLAKNKEFKQKAIEEFRAQRVYKEYVAWVDGIVAQSYEVDYPILTIKKGGVAKSRLSKSKGKPAHTYIEPLEIHGKKTKVKVIIKTGRTHQIRLHLARTEHPILGDRLYGGREWKRLMLHAKKIELLGYSFEAPEPEDFAIE